MWNLLLASTLAFAASPVQVETLDGQKLKGEVQSWTDAALILRDAQGEAISLPSNKLAMVRPLESDFRSFAAANAFVELVDGSKLEVAGYTVAGGDAMLRLRDGIEVSVPVKLIASARFKEFESSELTRQWMQIRQSKPAADLVVVKKGDALDFLEGVLGNITEDTAAFKLDGDQLSVKRTKLEGIVYFKNDSPSLPELNALVTTRGGLQLQARQVAWHAEATPTLTVATLAGVEFKLPWSTITKLDFAAGRVTYLADLSPESISYSPYFPLPDQQPLLAKFGRPAFNRSLEGGPLRYIPEPGSDTSPAEYQRGIALRSHSELTYRLPDKFTRLRALAFIDARMRGAGNVRLSIFGDERPLFETEIAGRQPPVEIDLDIRDVRRVKIVVDYGADSDIGDHLDLAEARVTK